MPKATKKLSIVIPTLNEEHNVAPLVQSIHDALVQSGFVYELIFVDDYSTDDTFVKLAALSASYPIQVHLKKGERGKAQSLRQGFAEARYGTIVMIDADLQYSPEYIPAMFRKMEEENLDIVVADRRENEGNAFRRLVSRAFNLLFVRILHGLKVDSQSGLKMFRKRVLENVVPEASGWAFDLDFLVKARHAGFRIGSIPITFLPRLAGQAKISVLRASWQIGADALRLKFQGQSVLMLGKDEIRKKGRGFRYKGAEFVHHADLHHRETALKRFGGRQVEFLILAACFLAVCLFINWHGTVLVLFGLLTFLYFADLMFNLFLIVRSFLKRPELVVTDREINDWAGEWPMYTVFCPLYKEWQVIPQFVKAMSSLDYPKDRLQVMLLLEENDEQTIAKAREFDLPDYFDVVIVPHSMPKTKPKALNYGLMQAQGKYVVIYDAEDVPDPRQLKKAVLAFELSGRETICVQAKLNFYNPHQNILTRVFTAEYSLWFDLVLPGMQSIAGPIPLGGTSNHFRTRDVHRLKGWDAFNVTEDCDLGIRLAKHGYKTAIIESTTLEEANSHLWNWLSQRSRWIKGYIQTYLVHMRNPRDFIQKNKHYHLLAFQFIVGGKILSMFINPLMWCVTISYFAFRATAGPVIETFFPSVILYVGVFSFVFGNFLYLYYYMIACAKRGHYDLIKYVYLVPFYWLMMSLASWRAVWEMIVKPHYWAKTMHGLHLQSEKGAAQAQMLAGVEVSGAGKPGSGGSAMREAGRSWLAGGVTQAGVLVAVTVLVNFLNFVFNAFLGRQLSYEQFGLLTFLNTLISLAIIFFAGLGATVNHRTAYLNGRYGQQAGSSFTRMVRRRTALVAVVVGTGWLLLSGWIAQTFQIDDMTAVAAFSPVFLLAGLAFVNRGFLQGNLKFVFVSLIILTEGLVKLLAAFGFVYLGYGEWAYLSIPISLAMAALLSVVLARKGLAVQNQNNGYAFPKRFYAAAVVTGLSSALFLSVDVIMAKRYLDPVLAGEYSLLSLVGKMVYFLGGLLNVFMITYVSRDLGEGRDPSRTFRYLLMGCVALTGVAVVGVGYLGEYTVPFLLGDKTAVILEHLPLYSLSIGLFTVVATFVMYHLAREEYSFSALAFGFVLVLAGGIMFQHGSIAELVQVVLYTSLAASASIVLLHFVYRSGRFVLANLVDLLNLFMPLHGSEAAGPDGKRILIFNWRDTRHAMAGGAEVYVHELAKRWVKSGHHVTLFCGNDGQCPRNETMDGVRVIRRGGFYLVYFWAFVYYLTRFRGRFNVIFDCHNGIPFFTPLYAKERIYSVLHHVHQRVFYKYLPRPLAWFAAVLENRLMPYAYRKVKFITVSPSTKQEMEELELTGTGIEIVYNGVDLNVLKPGEKAADPTVLYLGRLKGYKSVDVLIRAFQTVVLKMGRARLVIAGGGEEAPRLKKLAKSLGLDGRVEFLGKVTESEKIRLLQSAWVLVNPSMMEGWGITTIEANACGTPVIASNVPGLRDSVRSAQTGFLVDYGKADQMGARIVRLLEDEQLRERMSMTAVRWAQKFSWDASSRKGLELVHAR